jgi:hypothetical protein
MLQTSLISHHQELTLHNFLEIWKQSAFEAAEEHMMVRRGSERFKSLLLGLESLMLTSNV